MWQSFTQSFVSVLYRTWTWRRKHIHAHLKSQNNGAEISEVVYGLKVGKTFNLKKSLQKLLVALIVTQNTSSADNQKVLVPESYEAGGWVEF